MVESFPDRLQKPIGIVILNWNGWRDTIEAVESTRTLTYQNHQVYVVDNASTDDSEERLRTWDPALTVIQSGGNLGWSGGNNVGIRAALKDGCEHVLLLNNDAMIRSDALTHLADEADRLPDAGALGSLIVSCRDPTWIEYGGCDIDPRTGMPRQLYGSMADLRLPADPIPAVMVKGCAMLLTATGLARIGLLTEDYFLNFDEADWCYRANAAGLRHYLVPRSIVEHKGAASFEGTEGPLYCYFITRNRLVFARRHLDRRGRRFAWRSALWELRRAFGGAGAKRMRNRSGKLSRVRLPIALTVLIAVFDYCRGRLGDCPGLIRAMNRRYRYSGV
jgi:GT2 family glycosyltransferase